MNRFSKFVLITTIIASMFAQASIAQAVAANTVTPLSSDWVFVNDNGTTGDWDSGFENGPAVPPLGNGSVYIQLNSASAGIIFGTQKYQGTLLSDITALNYSTYTNLSPAAMTFQINYDPDLTTSESTWYGRLTYEPYMNGTVTNNTWQSWDMIDSGNGKWWASPNANSTVDDTCPQASPCTWMTILATFPNIGIRNDAISFIQFKAGSNWNGFDGNVDNFTFETGGNTDLYDFELPDTVYVDDSWIGTIAGTDPDGAGPATLFGADAFDVIQEGIDGVKTGGTVQVYAGTYAEDLSINNSLTLLGPNSAVNPNTGTRVAEAIIHPATSNPDPNVCTVMAYLSVSDVTIKGFTFDGDNPLLTSGVMIGSADVDACEILAGYEGMGNITVENNVLKNSTYSGIDFYNYTNSSATSGNYIRYNLLQDIGETTYNWGIGILIYNNFYADITDNVLTGVRTGIQTGNFSAANPGVTGNITNNQIGTWRLGIFHNLAYSNASALTIANNTFTAENYPGATKWNGILLSSIGSAVNATISNNDIVIPGDVSYTSPGYTAGYNIWNITTTAPITISGGTVTGGNYGIWVNNFEGYSSNADNTSITIDGVTINNATTAGILVADSTSNTNGATVYANIQNSTISNSTTGILLSGSDATAKANLNKITGNTTAGITNTSGNLMDAEKNWWNDLTGPSGTGTGTGDSVSADVDFTPWCGDAACSFFVPPFPLTVTADNQTIAVGDPDPVFTFTYDGFVNGDTSTNLDTEPVCSAAEPHNTPGNYPITCSGGSDTKYVFSYVDGTLTVTAANNPPTDISLSNASVNENAAIGTTVGTLTTADVDVSDTFTYSLVNGGVSCPGTDNASFQIAGDLLKTNAVFDFETKNSYTICVQTDDGNAGTFDKEFVITVNDLAETTSTVVRSSGSLDGWILESAERSGIGGTKNSAASTLNLGDDSANRQYRSILSFNTAALPDNAVITKVVLKFKYAGKTGTLPFSTHGNLFVDVRKSPFSNNPALQLADFNATPTKFKVLTYNQTLINGWYMRSFKAGDFNKINKLGLTQFRLRFAKDDNNDFGADFLRIYSGNSGIANQPQLVIEWHLP